MSDEWHSAMLQKLTMEDMHEIARCLHVDMLYDEDRVSKYSRAIVEAIQALKQSRSKITVLDIGTGTGLLAMVAAQQSVQMVYACEACSPLAEIATEVIRRNGLADKIRVIGRSSWNLQTSHIDGPADLAIAEVFDSELIGEGALRTFRDARKHLLKADSVTIPHKARVFVRAVSSPVIGDWFSINQRSLMRFGLNIPPELVCCPSGVQSLNVHFDDIPPQVYTFVTEKTRLIEYNFCDMKSLRPTWKRNVRVALVADAAQNCRQVDALLLWWELDLLGQGSVVISTEPSASLGQPVYALYGLRMPLEKGCTHLNFVLEQDEFSYRFIPRLSTACQCIVHRYLSFHQLSQLNDASLNEALSAFYERAVLKSCAFYGCTFHLPLLALKSGASKVYCIFKNDNEALSQMLRNVASSSGVDVGTSLEIRTLSQWPPTEAVDYMFSDCHLPSSSTSWHGLENWLGAINLCNVVHCSREIQIQPSAVKILCVPVQLDHPSKASRGLKDVVGWDLSIFDSLSTRAAELCCSNVETAFLWENAAAVSLGPPTVLATLSALDMTSCPDHVSVSTDIVIDRNGIFNALWFWTVWSCDSDYGSTVHCPLRSAGRRWNRDAKLGVHHLLRPYRPTADIPHSFQLKFYLDVCTWRCDAVCNFNAAKPKSIQ